MWLLVSFVILFLYFRKRKRTEIVNKNILLLGASSGIGKELGLEYSKKNNVILVARRTMDLNSIKKDILHRGGQCDVFTCDWTKLEELEKLREFVHSKIHTIDHLILCAGIMSVLPFSHLCEKDNWQTIVMDMFNTNSFGPILATKTFLPELIESKGMITVISSVAGVIAAPTRTLYSATKHAVNGFFRALRMELKSQGVDVCIVMPGSVQTDLRKSAIDGTSTNQTKGMSAEECSSKIIDAMERREREVYLPSVYQLGAILVNIFPKLIDFLAERKYRNN
jgi:short-subunit dehydrogenase